MVQEVWVMIDAIQPLKLGEWTIPYIAYLDSSVAEFSEIYKTNIPTLHSHNS